MSVLNEIFEGWKNLIFEDDKVEEEAKRRMAICVGCDKFTRVKSCELCGCYMPAKVRSMKSKCGDNKW